MKIVTLALLCGAIMGIPFGFALFVTEHERNPKVELVRYCESGNPCSCEATDLLQLPDGAIVCLNVR